jgi:hypothetical protein
MAMNAGPAFIGTLNSEAVTFVNADWSPPRTGPDPFAASCCTMAAQRRRRWSIR